MSLALPQTAIAVRVAPFRCVLDTNVVLDWLVFNEPLLDGLRVGVRDGTIIVLTHAAASDELCRVLGYSKLKLDAARQEVIFDAYRAQTATVSDILDERSNLPPGFPRCQDRDDDHFLALTYRAKADALVSKDRAVLKLSKRAQKFGVRILGVVQMIETLDVAAR